MRRLLLLSITALLLYGCAPEQTTYPMTPRNAYDAVTLLGIGETTGALLPTPKEGEVVITYGGWSLRELLMSVAGKQYLWMSEEDAESDWAKRSFPPGTYTIKPAEPAPAVILASALLSYRIQNGPIDFDRNPKDPLLSMADKLHCEDGGDKDRVGMYWGDDWGEDGKTHSIKLAVDRSYCAAMGGGIWEATK